jgi:hypothetical protein
VADLANVFSVLVEFQKVFPREKMKMCPLEFTATPETSPRYIPAGSLIALGTESKAMSGAPCANSASGAHRKNTKKNANFFIETSPILSSGAPLFRGTQKAKR